MFIRIAGTVNDSIVDGPGLRFTIFTQGCTHRCEGCHNPQTWDINGGYIEDTDILIKKMLKNPLLHGITLSGGEPFMQVSPCTMLAKAAHDHGLTVWTYTGYTWEELTAMKDAKPLLYETDVLVDGRYIISERSLELNWRGSKNQRLVEVQRSLCSGKLCLSPYS